MATYIRELLDLPSQVNKGDFGEEEVYREGAKKMMRANKMNLGSVFLRSFVSSQ